MARSYPVSRMRIVLLTLAGVLASNGPLALAADGDAAALMKRAIGNVTASESGIQNYTCIETVGRNYFAPRASTLPRPCSAVLEQRQHPGLDMALRLESFDRLRLEVTTTAAGEIFSWVGARKFDDAGIDDLVRQGPIGTGAFGAFLGVIFDKDVKQFFVVGENMFEGRRLMEYSFRVPRGDSHYRVRLADGTGWFTAAYDGTVLVDPQTADPIRLTIRTEELPHATESCQTMAELDYTRVKLGQRELLLPQRTTQRFVAPTGQETENTTTFSNCREYSTESTINFFGETDASALAAQNTSAAPTTIPGGMHFRLTLLAPIDSDQAAGGDRFAATLVDPLRQGKQTLAPKGSVVEGHVTLVKIFYLAQPQTVIALTPETVQVRGSTLHLSAVPDLAAYALALRSNRSRGVDIFLPPPGERAGLFRFHGKRAIMNRGFASDWLTVRR
jgi:hypothetical protein